MGNTIVIDMGTEQDMLDTNNAEAATRQPTLLFVDDETNILASLRRLFRSTGYKVLIAESGAKGLSLFEQENIDLVISDMRMPEMDGAQFLEQVSIRWPATVRILLTGYADMQSTIDAINKGNIYKYVSKPWEDNELKLSVKYALEQKNLKEERDRLLVVTARQNEELKDLNANLEQKVEARTEELRKAHELLKNSYVSSIKMFSGIIEVREGVNAGHAKRVAELARNIASDMGMSQKECQDILFAGLLHDIGKIGLSDKVLLTPLSELNSEERDEYKKHAVMGAALLTSIESFQGVAKLIRHHHEYYDGTGYPDEMALGNIPTGAMILSMLSDYDDLLTGTLTGVKYSQSAAIAYIKDNSGKHYNPDIVNVFLKRFGLAEEENKEISIQIDSDQLEPGMVLAENLYAGRNVLLLSEDHILDERFIESIRSFEKSMNQRFKISVRKGIRKG